MKIRTGFVSNSSSSSFICQWCGSSFIGERGYDPYFCDFCIDELPQKIELAIKKDALIQINKDLSYNDDLKNLLDSIGEKYIKEYKNEN